MDEQRDGTDSLVVVELTLGSIFQRCDGPMPHEVIQTIDRAVDNALSLGPRTALHEDGFEYAREKERLDQIPIAQMIKKIGVMTSVGGKHVVRDERQNRPGLLDILKAARPGFVQREQFLLQDFTENLPRKFRA